MLTAVLVAADALLVVLLLLLVLLLWFTCAAALLPLLLLLPLLALRLERCLAAGAALLLLLLLLLTICDAIQPSKPRVDASAASAGDTAAAAAAAATAEHANSVAARCLAGAPRCARVLLQLAWQAVCLCPTLSCMLCITAAVQTALLMLLVVLAGRSAARCLPAGRQSCMCLLTVQLLPPPEARAGSSGIPSGLLAEPSTAMLV
jgi:hypothetical protein